MHDHERLDLNGASDLFAVEVAATGGAKRNSCKNIKFLWDTSFLNEEAHGASINESSKCDLGIFGWIEDNFDMGPKMCGRLHGKVNLWLVMDDQDWIVVCRAADCTGSVVTIISV